MKKIIIFTLLIFAAISTTAQTDAVQNLPRKEGAIEIKMINHVKIENKDGNLTRKISNKENKPRKYLYLDTLGNLIEEVGYGKYHNRDLRVLDYVTIYKYEESKIIESIKYETSYEDNIYPKYRTKYFYDEKEQLIREEVLEYDNNRIFMQLDYTYDSMGNRIKSCIDNTCYIRTFDDENRVLSLQQFHENNLRWEWLYTYTESSRVGNFKTYYDDGKNWTKQEIILYQNGNLKQVEELDTSDDALSKMSKYHYNRLGLITRIEYYRKYSLVEGKYEFIRYEDIKTRIACKFTKQLVKQINNTVLDIAYEL
jgi:hypothetical protein